MTRPEDLERLAGGDPRIIHIPIGKRVNPWSRRAGDMLCIAVLAQFFAFAALFAGV